ncbi:hypothetical protein Tcan_01722, partial [Toxocara canis]
GSCKAFSFTLSTYSCFTLREFFERADVFKRRYPLLSRTRRVYKYSCSDVLASVNISSENFGRKSPTDSNIIVRLRVSRRRVLTEFPTRQLALKSIWKQRSDASAPSAGVRVRMVYAERLHLSC